MTADILNKAADILEQQGWIQRSYGIEPGGPHCAMGALNVAAGTGPIGRPYGKVWPAAIALLDHLGRTPEVDDSLSVLNAVINWNDLDHQTRETVVKALRDTAEGLDE